MLKSPEIAESFSSSEKIVIFSGDCLDLLKLIPDGSLQLIITSPPYKIGKEGERRLRLDRYLEQQAMVIPTGMQMLPQTPRKKTGRPLEG